MGATDSKKTRSRVAGWAITAAVVVIFVGAQQIHPGGLFGLIRDAFVGAAANPDGKAHRDKMLASLVPIGAAALCLKQHGENAALRDALASHLQRNKSAMRELIETIEDNGGMSNAEKDLLDRQGYQEAHRFVGEGSEAEQTCGALAARFNSGEFDL